MQEDVHPSVAELARARVEGKGCSYTLVEQELLLWGGDGKEDAEGEEGRTVVDVWKGRKCRLLCGAECLMWFFLVVVDRISGLSGSETGPRQRLAMRVDLHNQLPEKR